MLPLSPFVSIDAWAKARIFTPRRELPFAGHPTIGAASVLSNSMALPQSFFLEEAIGLVKIDAGSDASGDPLFWLTTPPVTFYETLDPEFCARLLGLTLSDIRSDVPPTFVSAGAPLLFICLRSVDAVDRAELQERFLSDALGSVNSVGTFLFARKAPQSTTNLDVYSRMFAPQTGVREDPATGGATGPLAAYMMRYGLLPANEPAEFVSEQGTKMNRQSFLFVQTTPAREGIKVGGSTVNVARGALELSEDLLTR